MSKDLNILDLPTEILIKISKDVDPDVRLDLVCRKLCTIANFRDVFSMRQPCNCHIGEILYTGNCPSKRGHRCVCYGCDVDLQFMLLCHYEGDHLCQCNTAMPWLMKYCRCEGGHPCMCHTGDPGVIEFCRCEGDHPCMCHLSDPVVIQFCRHEGEHPCMCHTGETNLINFCHALQHQCICDINAQLCRAEQHN